MGEEIEIPLDPPPQLVLKAAMTTLTRENISLRPLQAGDIGWIIHRHAVAIAPEFGWGLEFEAMCARILGEFVEKFQPGLEQSWIACSAEGEILGSLLLIRENATTARLRTLYLESKARGLGLATRLLDAAFAFAHEAGYTRMMLFTTSDNTVARQIYVKRGFTCTQSEPMLFSGKMLDGETWERPV